jgi:hypothetical protein
VSGGGDIGATPAGWRPLPPEEEAALPELRAFPPDATEEERELLRALYRYTCRELRRIELGLAEDTMVEVLQFERQAEPEL